MVLENWPPENIKILSNKLRERFPSAQVDYDSLAWGIRNAVGHEQLKWKHNDVNREIENIERVLRELKKISELSHLVATHLKSDAMKRSDEFHGHIDRGEISPIQAAHIAPTLHNVLGPSLKAAKNVLPIGYEGKADLAAVGVVDACRSVWRACTGDEAPKSLNEASEFGKFVADIFEAVGVERNPRSTMDAWARIQRTSE